MKILNIPLLLSIVRVVEGRVLAGTGGIEKKRTEKEGVKRNQRKGNQQKIGFLLLVSYEKTTRRFVRAPKYRRVDCTIEHRIN